MTFKKLKIAFFMYSHSLVISKGSKHQGWQPWWEPLNLTAIMKIPMHVFPGRTWRRQLDRVVLWPGFLLTSRTYWRQQFPVVSSEVYHLVKTEVSQLFVQYTHTLAYRECMQPCVSGVLREGLFWHGHGHVGNSHGTLGKAIICKSHVEEGRQSSPLEFKYKCLWILLIVYAKTSKD